MELYSWNACKLILASTRLLPHVMLQVFNHKKIPSIDTVFSKGKKNNLIKNIKTEAYLMTYILIPR